MPPPHVLGPGLAAPRVVGGVTREVSVTVSPMFTPSCLMMLFGNATLLLSMGRLPR